MGKTHYTKITPLARNIPRQLALDLLHSHEELIRLNPLVTGVEAIERPSDARLDEYYAHWYQIHEIMTWGPGMKKKMSFRGVFHDVPTGLQSHTYAPLGTDLRQRYTIGGNQPGEEPEMPELGVAKPVEGLYLREEHEINCAVPLTAGFVKKEMKAATGVMIERLNLKASMLEEGKLHAMFEAGRLKTSKPSRAPTFFDSTYQEASSSRLEFGRRDSQSTSTSGGRSPVVDAGGFGNYHDVARAESVNRSRRSMLRTSPSLDNAQRTHFRDQQLPAMSELAETSIPYRKTSAPVNYAVELPADSPPPPPDASRPASLPQSPRPVSSAPSQSSATSHSRPTSDVPEPLRYPRRGPSTSSSNYSDHSAMLPASATSIQPDHAVSVSSREHSQRSAASASASSAPPASTIGSSSNNIPICFVSRDRPEET